MHSPLAEGVRNAFFPGTMASPLDRIRAQVPDSFLAALAVGVGFMLFVAWDQMHWWRVKEDYSFGWLVPLFVAYAVFDRWPRIVKLMESDPAAPGAEPNWATRLTALAFGAAMAVGVVFFALGAVYRAGAGSSQPGSLALALGFAGLLLGMVYFNTPAGAVPVERGQGGWLQPFLANRRLRVAAWFLFPALIWVISAPLVSAVENTLSLFLLNQVVKVVFFVFGMLGYPLVQEGNVLHLPEGSVGVADACSGIRSLTACLFAGSFLAAVFLDRLWKKVALVAAAMLFAFVTNLLRSVFLTAWAYAYGADAIEGTIHDATGYAVLGLTCVGLLCLLPLFNAANWHRWLGAPPPPPAEEPSASASV